MLGRSSFVVFYPAFSVVYNRIYAHNLALPFLEIRSLLNMRFQGEDIRLNEVLIFCYGEHFLCCLGKIGGSLSFFNIP